ncbi:SpoIIE family protein phosphatase [Candidatus Methylocalor cossyra]|uniref:FHA domain-containing protein n=1 Tax=Candidatus Methylocalor cossyra TaxID=3108543 RepID=A0ABM9NJE7_9GAMM
MIERLHKTLTQRRRPPGQPGGDGGPTLLRPRRSSAGEIAHYIVVVEGAESGKEIETGLEPTTIGRHADNRLCLADPFVSGHHCTVVFKQGRVLVTDAQSTNGTYIDGVRVQGCADWPLGGLLQVGSQVLKQEFRERGDRPHSERWASELRRAAGYVRALLPKPLDQGPVRVAWQFLPSAQLSGDIFDYFWLDADHFAFYLLDVCGHGIGAALHSVSVSNLLHQRALPEVDFSQPKEVLAGLNQRLPMEAYANMYFTVWYGVYDSAAKTLTFASGGHPPALLFSTGQEAGIPLSTGNPPIGVVAEYEFHQAVRALPPGSLVYLYSDGVYEWPRDDGTMGNWTGFMEFLQDAVGQGLRTPDLILRQMLAATPDGRFEDDFSLLALSFRPE